MDTFASRVDSHFIIAWQPFDNEQWQALIALHSTSLHEQHDFFLASQYHSASPALRPLVSKYAMPARMWRHATHSFLELWRYQLPGYNILYVVFITQSLTPPENVQNINAASLPPEIRPVLESANASSSDSTRHPAAMLCDLQRQSEENGPGWIQPRLRSFLSFLQSQC
jgi:hypothetical protein